MQLTLVYFAQVRELMQTKQTQLSCAETITTVADLQQWLQENNADFAAMQQKIPQLLVAVNQSSAQGSTALTHNDEVAFFPPVTGG